jgi:Pyridoxamine 5'-phosphate oxidase
MRWSDFSRAAPALADSARARFEATRIALLGTSRADGSPRISPIEPYFTPDELVLGAMACSLKARDLRRDPRCVLHSAVTEPDAGEPEFKLYGKAVPADPRDVPATAWWLSYPGDAAFVFTLELESAAAVTWELERGAMTITRWTSQNGLEETTRSYP